MKVPEQLQKMKYKVGDKVIYDSGDLCFYGTVTAIIENSVSPCYQLNVDCMVKKNCKSSITQFEFELEWDNEFERDKDNFKWENSEIEYLKKYHNAQNKAILSESVKPEPVPEHPPFSILPNPVPKPKPEIKQALKQEKVDTPQEPKEEIAKRKRTNTWDTNLELYCKGEKGYAIYSWISQNRKQYKAGNLKEDRLKKLLEIDFPFVAVKKVAVKKEPEPELEETIDIWHKQLRQWKNGDHRASLQQWREKNIKRFLEGKLSADKIEKLKEVGIIREDV